MQSSKDLFDPDNMYEYDIEELTLETPIGWSSACFDQTINYYIDCNYTNLKENFEKDAHNS